MAIKKLEYIITDFKADKHTISWAGVLLNQVFSTYDGYPTIEEALNEVEEALSGERINRVAICPITGQKLGWIGAIPQYKKHTWELHPLVVSPTHQRKGVGSALFRDLEEQIKKHGGKNIYLGTDDVYGGTNLFGQDLYPDVVTKLNTLTVNPGGHPVGFYKKMGMSVVGIIPDANWKGAHDIFMAKRLS
jgi:aminoglycoside 6'-N-acetyltransferase I